jgi:hypothetical protein
VEPIQRPQDYFRRIVGDRTKHFRELLRFSFQVIWCVRGSDDRRVYLLERAIYPDRVFLAGYSLSCFSSSILMRSDFRNFRS